MMKCVHIPSSLWLNPLVVSRFHHKGTITLNFDVFFVFSLHTKMCLVKWDISTLMWHDDNDIPAIHTFLSIHYSCMYPESKGPQMDHDATSIWPESVKSTQIAKFMGPTRGPPGSCRPQVGPMLAPWTLLWGNVNLRVFVTCVVVGIKNIWIYSLFKYYFHDFCHRFKLSRLITYSVPSQYLNYCWAVITYTFWNKC